MSQYSNVMAHCVDILHQLLGAHVPRDHDHRQLANDVLEVLRSAISGNSGAAAAGVIGHAVFERHVAFSRDDRYEAVSLPAHLKSKAALQAVDSSEYVFGSARDILDKDIRKNREDFQCRLSQKPVLVDAKGQVKGSSASSFRQQQSGSKKGGPAKSSAKAAGTQSQQQQQQQKQQPKQQQRKRGGKGGSKENKKPQ